MVEKPEVMARWSCRGKRKASNEFSEVPREPRRYRQASTHLRLGHEINEGLDHAGRLSLTDERRGGGNDCLGTRHLHRLEEDPGEFLDNPAHSA